jgi:hypothetical protein
MELGGGVVGGAAGRGGIVRGQAAGGAFAAQDLGNQAALLGTAGEICARGVLAVAEKGLGEIG